MGATEYYGNTGVGSDSPLQRARSLGMVRAKKGGPRIAAALTIVVAVVAACLVFVPIQQTVNGYGQVIVYSAMDRPQNIEAQIKMTYYTAYVGQPTDKPLVVCHSPFRFREMDTLYPCLVPSIFDGRTECTNHPGNRIKAPATGWMPMVRWNGALEGPVGSTRFNGLLPRGS